MMVLIDQETCIGCGRCVEICPAVFFLDETIGASTVLDEDACDYTGCCEAAAENCPVHAITIDDQ